METPRGSWYVGTTDDAPAHIEADHLTTHGVIVGMTGSGKTGLGIIALEEALLGGVPAIVIDPKGDMGNLALVFPDLAPGDFEPWVDPAEAARQDITPAELAERVAATWAGGLERSGITPDRLRGLVEGAEVTVYTPGSSAGVPLDLLGALRAPDGAEGETLREEVQALTSSLLVMAGLDADPLTSPEHILVATIIESAWVGGEHLDLPTLIGRIQRPPFRKLGVFDVDTFMPEAARTGLAMRINNLVASPSFGAWLTGAPLDVDQLTRTPDGRPRAAVINIAHLGDTERQMVVTMVLAKVVTWMRRQSGTSSLRLLVYMDEMFGFAPPTANPPSKQPILTLLKQARAHGVGLLLSTQNPVDLDYKAMSNAGTWLVGRLQTERDKTRILEGLRSAGGDADLGALGDVIGGLEARHFLHYSARGGTPPVFSTRWAMSYLAGPLSRPQIERLTAGTPPGPDPASATAPAPTPEPTATPVADDETVVEPTIKGARHVDPAAPWLAEVGASPTGTRLVAGVAARVSLQFSDRTAQVYHTEEWEAIAFPAPVGPPEWIPVDHDPRDLIDTPPDGARYVLPDAPLTDATYLRGLRDRLIEHLVANEQVTIWRNTHLKLYSRIGEDEQTFRARCVEAAGEAADRELAQVRSKIDQRRRTIQQRLAAAEAQASDAEAAANAKRQEDLLSGASDLLGSLLTGRSASGGLRRLAKSRTSAPSARQRTAETKVQTHMLELLALEEEFDAKVLEVTDAWQDRAGNVETMDIGLVKTRISVDDLVVVWLPT